MKLFCDNCGFKREVTDEWRGGGCQPGHSIGERIYRCTYCASDVIQPVFYGKLIDQTFDEACAIKFKIGRAEHGPVFLNNPVEEIDMELIDARNYADEAIRQGFDLAEMNHIIAKIRELDVLVRKVYLSRT